MPRREDIEKFKEVLNSLGGEPEIMARRSQAIEDVRAPDEVIPADLGELPGSPRRRKSRPRRQTSAWIFPSLDEGGGEAEETPAAEAEAGGAEPEGAEAEGPAAPTGEPQQAEDTGWTSAPFSERNPSIRPSRTSNLPRRKARQKQALAAKGSRESPPWRSSRSRRAKPPRCNPTYRRWKCFRKTSAIWCA